MRVFFSTGEPSGEYHAVELARAMARRAAAPPVFEGIGSGRMRAAGFKLWLDTRGWASMGIVAALRKIPRLLIVMLATAARLRLHPPDLIVLVDFGAFNLRLARQLRRTGYRGPIVYYIPPGAWWDRPKPAKMVAAATLPLTIFRHQAEFYAGLGLPVAFFGHPLAALIAPRPAREAPPAGGGTIAILPGSRRGEIDRHVGPLLAAAEILVRERPELRFVVGAANDDARRAIERQIAGSPLRIAIVSGAQNALRDADGAWICSGTAVLEAALIGVPSVLLYITSEAQAKLARRMYAKIGGRFVGLPNLVLDRAVVPELWQEQATPEALAAEMRGILADPTAQLHALAGLRDALGASDALDRSAQFALDAAAG